MNNEIKFFDSEDAAKAAISKEYAEKVTQRGTYETRKWADWRSAAKEIGVKVPLMKFSKKEGNFVKATNAPEGTDEILVPKGYWLEGDRDTILWINEKYINHDKHGRMVGLLNEAIPVVEYVRAVPATDERGYPTNQWVITKSICMSGSSNVASAGTLS